MVGELEPHRDGAEERHGRPVLLAAHGDHVVTGAEAAARVPRRGLVGVLRRPSSEHRDHGGPGVTGDEMRGTEQRRRRSAERPRRLRSRVPESTRPHVTSTVAPVSAPTRPDRIASAGVRPPGRHDAVTARPRRGRRVGAKTAPAGSAGPYDRSGRARLAPPCGAAVATPRPCTRRRRGTRRFGPCRRRRRRGTWSEPARPFAPTGSIDDVGGVVGERVVECREAGLQLVHPDCACPGRWLRGRTRRRR